MFTRHSALTKKFLATSALAFASCISMAANANVITLTGKLAGANEVPANASSGMGTVEATFNKETNELTWKVVYSGLTGPAAAGHFHGPAMAGQNAGVVVPLKGSVESPIMGQATITPEQAQDLLAGKWYVNLHTKVSPGGELRAQVMPTN